MIIKIADLIGNKFIKLDVPPDVKLRDLMEHIISQLNLPSDYSYILVYRNKELGEEYFDKTLTEIGIRENDELQLLGRPIGA